MSETSALAGSKPCSISQRIASRLRKDQHADDTEVELGSALARFVQLP